MNFSSAIMLFNKDIRAVATIYDLLPGPDGKDKPQKHIVMKTLDKTIKVGDLVIVPTETRYQFSINKVVEIDVEVDFESTVEIKWIVNKVDRDGYDSVLAMEKQSIEVMRSAEKRRKREELMASILKDNPDMQDLSIVKATPAALAAPVTIEQPPAYQPPAAPHDPEYMPF